MKKTNILYSLQLEVGQFWNLQGTIDLKLVRVCGRDESIVHSSTWK